MRSEKLLLPYLKTLGSKCLCGQINEQVWKKDREHAAREFKEKLIKRIGDSQSQNKEMLEILPNPIDQLTNQMDPLSKRKGVFIFQINMNFPRSTLCNKSILEVLNEQC